MSFPNGYLSLITNFIFEKGVGKEASGSTTFDLSNQLMLMDVIDNIILVFLVSANLENYQILIPLALKSIYTGFN